MSKKDYVFDYGLCKSDCFGLNPTPGGINYLRLTADSMRERLIRDLEPEFRQLSWLTSADPESSRYISWEEIRENTVDTLPYQGMLYPLFEEAAKHEKRKDTTPESDAKITNKLNALRRQIYDAMKDYARDLAADYVSGETGLLIGWMLIEGGEDES